MGTKLANTVTHVQALQAADEYLADAIAWHKGVMGKRFTAKRRKDFSGGFHEGFRQALNFLNLQGAMHFESEDDYALRKQAERAGNAQCPHFDKCLDKGCLGLCANARDEW